MTAQLLDGKLLASLIRQDIAARIKARQANGLRAPGLAVIIVGDDPASEVYVRNKRRASEEVGIVSTIHHLSAQTTEASLLQLITQLNEDDNVDGILLQLPLPKHINEHALLEAIQPEKDVDGFHPYNLGRLTQRRPLLRPCTPYGIIKLLQHAKIELAGKNAVVVGASNIVGRPMALELLLTKSTVTICHKFTADLQSHIKNADILIVAIGKTDIINSNWIKPGAVVVDVGMNRLPDGSLVGDVEFETAKHKASWITPVPGGVGPMTVAMLLHNTLYACELKEKNVITSRE